MNPKLIGNALLNLQCQYRSWGANMGSLDEKKGETITLSSHGQMDRTHLATAHSGDFQSRRWRMPRPRSRGFFVVTATLRPDPKRFANFLAAVRGGGPNIRKTASWLMIRGLITLRLFARICDKFLLDA